MRTMWMLFLTLMLGASAWSGTTGKLAGKVTDSRTKEPLIGVAIIIEGTNLGAATDLDGNFVILNIPPGKYRVLGRYIGYQPVVVSDVSISIDLTTKLDMELSESTVEVDAVVIEAKRDVVKKDVTSSQSFVSSSAIEALPVAEMDDVLQLQAGVTRDASGGFHIRGGRSSEIAYWVNGVSVTDAFDNSRGIQIDNSSIQELQVISGTFNAEYGNAMSGIVNTVTKEGSGNYRGSIMVFAGDHASNFVDYFQHVDNFQPLSTHNFQASLSGPVPFFGDDFKFFVNGRYYYDDGYLKGERRYTTGGSPGDGEVVPMDWRRNTYGQMNLSYLPTNSIKLNLEGLYSSERFQDYAHEYRWNPDGNVLKRSESFTSTATLNHMLSSTTFYTAKVSYFSKEFREHLYDDPYDSRYLHPDSLFFVSYAFRPKGTNLHRFFRRTNTLVGKLDATSQITASHLIKAGAEVRYHDLTFDDFTLEPLRVNNIEVVPFQPSIPAISQPNRELYDASPFEASVYLQDKIEYESVIINLGIRIDYFDSHGKVLLDVTDPNIYAPLRPGVDSLSIAEREPLFYKNADAKFQISPRFGVAYPVSDAGVIHFSYGHFLQIPPFQYLFNRGMYKVPNDGLNLGVYGNPNLNPQRTVMYEIGFRQELAEDYSIDVTGFYRDVRDWITSGPFVQTRNLVTYSSYVNKDYANVKGITLTFNRRLVNNLSFDVNYTYQVAEGSNSRPEEEFEAQSGSAEPSLFLIPMDWDQNHLLNASLSTTIEEVQIGLLARYGTGLPYTPSITQYTADRGLTSGLTKNSRRIPAQFTIDLRFDRSFRLPGVEMTLFARVFNLLDSRIPIRVFGDTGQPDFTTTAQSIGFDANRPNTVEEYLKYPFHYAEPRNVQFGVELSF